MAIKRERKIEVLTDGEFKEFKFEDIKKGMIFRMFESDGTKVKDDDGCTEFRALKDIQYSKNQSYVQIIGV
jgi:hypothetical protein